MSIYMSQIFSDQPIKFRVTTHIDLELYITVVKRVLKQSKSVISAYSSWLLFVCYSC